MKAGIILTTKGIIVELRYLEASSLFSSSMFFSSSLLSSSSLLALLVPAEQELSDAEEVDHLRDPEQRRDHDHPAKSSLQKCAWSLIHQDLFKCVGDAFVRLFTRPLLKNLVVSIIVSSLKKVSAKFSLFLLKSFLSKKKFETHLQPGLHHVEGVDGGGGDRPGSHAGDERPPEELYKK